MNPHMSQMDTDPKTKRGHSPCRTGSLFGEPWETSLSFYYRNRMAGICVLLVLGALAVLQPARADTIEMSVSEEGVTLSTPLELGGGRFILRSPVILGDDIYRPLRPEVKVIDAHAAELRFDGGALLTTRVTGTSVEYEVSGTPPGAKSIAIKMAIDREAFQGSTFSVDAAPAEPFPEEDERKFLREGPARRFTVTDPAGTTLSVAVVPSAHLRVTNKGPESWSHYEAGWTFPVTELAAGAAIRFEFSVRPASAQ